MNILQNIPEEKRKMYIGGGIAAVCFVLAITAYVALSGGDDANSAEVQAAIDKSKSLDQQIADQQPVVPDPPAPTAKSRSAVKADGTR
jgi:hypothetical protein